MEPGLLATAKEFISEYWLHVSGGVVAAAIRLLVLTGRRRNEILTLRWEHVDLEHYELRLRDASSNNRSSCALAKLQWPSCSVPTKSATDSSIAM